jgi:hypothetical protein
MSNSGYVYYRDWTEAVRNGSSSNTLRDVFKHLASKIASTVDQSYLSRLQYEFDLLSADDRDSVMGAYTRLPESHRRRFPLLIPPTPQTSVYNSTMQTPLHASLASVNTPQTPLWRATPTPVPGRPRLNAPRPQDEFSAMRGSYSRLSPVGRLALDPPQTLTPPNLNPNSPISLQDLLQLHYPRSPTSRQEYHVVFNSNDFLKIVDFSRNFSQNLTAYDVLTVSMTQFAVDCGNLIYTPPHQ